MIQQVCEVLHRQLNENEVKMGILFKIIDGLMGTPALHGAVLSNDLSQIKKILDNGADVNLRDKKRFGFTALMAAAFNGYTEAAKLLIAYGADVNAITSTGETALMVAARASHAEAMNLLIDNGAEVNAKTNNDGGITALMLAVATCNIAIVGKLIDRGADVNAECNDGWTVLKFASANNRMDLVRLLKAAGAS